MSELEEIPKTIKPIAQKYNLVYVLVYSAE